MASREDIDTYFGAGGAYPVVVATCACGHDENEHDETDECQIRGCSCDHFTPREA